MKFDRFEFVFFLPDWLPYQLKKKRVYSTIYAKLEIISRIKGISVMKNANSLVQVFNLGNHVYKLWQ